LVKATHFDTAGGESREELVVAVYVVVKAVYEDQFCNWRSVGLGEV
jgi:hypothetical protein